MLVIILFTSVRVSEHELFEVFQLLKETKSITCNCVDAIVNMTYSHFYQQS